MALVTSFQKIDKTHTVHSKQTVCGYLQFSEDGGRYLHLETYASGEHQDLDKPKQLLQFDESSAKELIKILKIAFPKLFEAD